MTSYFTELCDGLLEVQGVFMFDMCQGATLAATWEALGVVCLKLIPI